MTRRGRKRWKIMDRVVFGKTDDPYLDRLRVVQTPWASIYLHRILREDAERHLHDHPWPFASLVVKGGYTEIFARKADPYQVSQSTQVRTWRRWSLHRLGVQSAHRIIHVEPGTMTLVFVGTPIGREWGFYTEDGRVEWTRYQDRWDVLQGQVT